MVFGIHMYEFYKMRIISKINNLAKQSLMISSKDIYSRILNHFPCKDNLCLAFAYGSGVFPQKGQKTIKSNMLDLVFVIKDSTKWHCENLLLNPKHYSSIMRIMGPQKLANIQDNYGANCYYNTLIPLEGRKIKYGVITINSLITDLNHWEHLYIAGRLHKPVNIVFHDFESNPNLSKSMQNNLVSALLAAFLILPDTFSEKTLYMTIAGLSYTGDFRMKFGEDRKKIENIVQPNLGKFQDLYHPIIRYLQSSQHAEFFEWKQKQAIIEQDVSVQARHFHLQHLPLKIQQQLAKEFDKNARQIRDLDEVIRSIARYSEIDEVIVNSLTETINTSSKTQSIKGILTAGFFKSIIYSFNKVQKMIKSLF